MMHHATMRNPAMRYRVFAVLQTLCIAAILATAAQAQPLLTEKRDLTVFGARKLVDACLAEAARNRYPIAVAVVDTAGYLLSYEATDGPMAHTGVTAQLKAKTAAKFRRSTADLYERVNKQINRAPEWMGYFPVPGGYPIVVQGDVVGALGVGSAGLSGGRDEECAQNAITSVFGDGSNAPAMGLQPLLATHKVLTTRAARALIDACVAYADQKKYTALGISVVGPDGTLLSFQGTEGATSSALQTAELKATTAAHWRRPTIELWDRINKQVNRAPEWMGDFAQPGGFPIFLGSEMVGAIGAGGGMGSQDDECAQAAIKAVFPSATTGSGAG
jgi:glc operon protein GlcG